MTNPNNNIQVTIACLAAAVICEETSLTEEQVEKLESIYERLSKSNFAKNTINNQDAFEGVVAVFEEYLQGEGL